MIPCLVEGDGMQEMAEGAVLDPVCGMTVSPSRRTRSSTRNSTASPRDAGPSRRPLAFLTPNNPRNRLTPGTGRRYVPMHPEVQRPGLADLWDGAWPMEPTGRGRARLLDVQRAC
jgi:hypothetical protein